VELSDAGQNAVARLKVAIDKPEGQKWPERVLDDVLAILVLATAPLDELDAIEEAILAGLSIRAGILDPERKAPITGKEMADKIGAYFVANPLPNALMVEVNAALRELLSTNNAEKAAAAIASAHDSKVPVSQRAATEGSTRMGVMGRFGLSVPPKK
jgi:hypothetical protein